MTSDNAVSVDDMMKMPEPGDTKFSERLANVAVRTSATDMILDDVSRSQASVKDNLSLPPHMRGNVPTMLTCMQLARHWDMIPVMIAQQTYVIGGRLTYMSGLLHSVLNKCAPMQHRLRIEFGRRIRKEIDGEMRTTWVKDEDAPDSERRCRVWSKFAGDDFIYEYVSPVFDKITPKNSTQWKADPNQQHAYRSITAWGRLHCPEVLMGCYSKEEAEDHPNFGFDNARLVNEGLAERIAKSGFVPEADHPVNTELASAGHKALEPEIAPEPNPKVRKKPGPKPKNRTEAVTAPTDDPKPSGGKLFTDPEIAEMHETMDQVFDRMPELKATPDEPEYEPPASEPAAGDYPDMPETLVRTSAPDSLDELKIDPDPAPRQPRTREEYRLHLIHWLSEMGTKKDVKAKWDSERDLRTDLGFTEELRKPLIEEVTRRFNLLPAA